MTDFRALCAELVPCLQGRKDDEYGWPGPDPEQELLDRARAALAQPEPQGPTDEDIRDFAEYDHNFFRCDSSDNDGNKWLSWECDDVHLLAFARAVLARWNS
jgi:hypothetical protein